MESGIQRNCGTSHYGPVSSFSRSIYNLLNPMESYRRSAEWFSARTPIRNHLTPLDSAYDSAAARSFLPTPCFRYLLETTTSDTSPYSISPSSISSLWTFARIVTKPIIASFNSATKTPPSHFAQRSSILGMRSSTIAAPDGIRGSIERSKSCSSIRHARTPAICTFSSKSRINNNAVYSNVWRGSQGSVNRSFAIRTTDLDSRELPDPIPPGLRHAR